MIDCRAGGRHGLNIAFAGAAPGVLDAWVGRGGAERGEEAGRGRLTIVRLTTIRPSADLVLGDRDHTRPGGVVRDAPHLFGTGAAGTITRGASTAQPPRAGCMRPKVAKKTMLKLLWVVVDAMR